MKSRYSEKNDMNYMKYFMSLMHELHVLEIIWTQNKSLNEESDGLFYSLKLESFTSKILNL
jgi:hypothetical protein